MSRATPLTPERPSTDAEDRVADDGVVDDVLTALHDEDCRTVLAVTGEDALTAKEITERCDIPSSTVYRKIDRLTAVGLLDEGLRLRQSGTHSREYSRRVDHVSLALDDDGVALQIGDRNAARPQAAD